MKDVKAAAEILIRKPPEVVFDALTDADAMSRYWFTRRDDGLRAGEACTWFLGEGDDAIQFEINVVVLDRPRRLVFEWDEARTVTWRFDAVGDDTRVSVEETGFVGSDEEILAQVLDSTGGFNQVVVALKAWVEHGVALNLVADHA